MMLGRCSGVAGRQQAAEYDTFSDRRKMERKLGIVSATFLVIASMLGSGVLTTSGIIISLVKTSEALLGIWLLGGILAVLGALCYGELIESMPYNGGEATILRTLFTPGLGEVAGITSFIVGFAACNAVSSLAMADYLAEAFHSDQLNPKLIACLALFGVTALHGVFGPLGLRIQTLMAIGKFSILLLVVFYGISLAGNSAPVPPPVAATTVMATPPLSASAWGLATMFCMFAYSGWNAAIYVAGEVLDPGKNVRRAMVFGAAIVLVLYVGLNFILTLQIPAADMDGVRPIIALLVKRMFGPEISSLFSALVAFALLSSLGVAAFLGPRVLATMLNWSDRLRRWSAGDRDINPALIWAQMAISVFMVLTGSFVQVLTFMGFLLGLFPILCASGIYTKQCCRPTRLSKLVRYACAPIFIGISSSVLVLGAWHSPFEAFCAMSFFVAFLLLRAGRRFLGNFVKIRSAGH